MTPMPPDPLNSETENAAADRALVERFRRGDASAYDELFAAYGQRLYRFALRLCGSTADAEDLAQEVFLAAYIGLPFFEGRASLSTYLYKIAVYRWRRLRVRRARAGRADPTDRLVDPADPARIGLARVEIGAALAALPAAQREAFLLVKAEGFTSREAAEALGVPEGTVKWQVAEAGRRLRGLLEPLPDAPTVSVRPTSSVGPRVRRDAGHRSARASKPATAAASVR